MFTEVSSQLEVQTSAPASPAPASAASSLLVDAMTEMDRLIY